MNDASKYFVGPDSTISEAIEVIEKGAAQIALVVEDNRLVGTITDGDIRRAILRGQHFDAPIKNIMCRSFTSLPQNASEDEALELMKRLTINQVPVLSETGSVVKLFILEELIKPKSIKNSVVIMAGGRGERLYPLTKDCPKPMLNVAGRPLLETVLRQCISAGFTDIYIAVNYLKQQIIDHFADGSKWGVKIQYIEEEKPLGTAGALSLINQKPKQPILLLNGDVLTQVNYQRLLKYHEAQGASITVCLREHITQLPYGVMKLDDMNVVAIEEKPVLRHQVNAGIYIIDPAVLTLVPPNEFFDMPQLLTSVINQGGKVSGFPMYEYWLDVGHIETLKRADAEWK